jgi:hypothetical protein
LYDTNKYDIVVEKYGILVFDLKGVLKGKGEHKK